ncbi:MAG: hypothetical protein WC600_17030 [Desulfobaccales bacterium]
MTIFLWLFWPLASGGTWQDRRKMAAYAALILAPLVLIFLGWLWYGPSLMEVVRR